MPKNKAVDITESCLQWYAETNKVRNGYISANDAADYLGISRARITQLVHEVGFHAVKLGTVLYLPENEVMQYNANRKWAEITDMEGC